MGKITAVNGDVNVQRDGKLIPAMVGFKLKKQDKVITGKFSRSQIVFSDNTIISLGKNSTISVEEYFYEVGNKPKATFGFGNGVFKSISGKISKLNPTKYKLKTKSASIGIRGTIVGLDLSDEKETYMVLQGKIEVRHGNKRMILNSGRQFSSERGVASKPERINRRSKEKLERDSGAKENERESGRGESTQSKSVTSAEKCNYR